MTPDFGNVTRITDHLVRDQRRQFTVTRGRQLQRHHVHAAASQSATTRSGRRTPRRCNSSRSRSPGETDLLFLLQPIDRADGGDRDLATLPFGQDVVDRIARSHWTASTGLRKGVLIMVFP